MHTRSDSQIPWDKVGIDYLGTQECGGELGKVLFGDGVGALRGSSARRRWTPRNNAMRKNNVGMATRRFLLEIFILNSIQNYTKIINTVLISYRRNNAVSMLFTTWHGWFIFGSYFIIYILRNNFLIKISSRVITKQGQAHSSTKRLTIFCVTFRSAMGYWGAAKVSTYQRGHF